MSYQQRVLRAAIVGGAAALVGRALADGLAIRAGFGGGRFDAAVTLGLIGGLVGAALAAVQDGVRPGWRRRAGAIIAGAIVGLVAGAIGGTLGRLVTRISATGTVLAWVVLGAGAGSATGLFERSRARLWEGIAGGALGGLAGGLLFGPIAGLLAPGSPGVGRAFAAVVLGACLGAALVAATGLIAPARLTVLGGDRPGRRLFLASQPVLLGRSGDADLDFTRAEDSEVEPRHVRILPKEDGRFLLEDVRSRHGTTVNRARLVRPTFLHDGDLIQIGPNTIRFNQRRGRTCNVADSSARANSSPQPGPAAASSPNSSPLESSGARLSGAKLPTGTGVPNSTGGLPPLPRGMTRCPKCQRPVLGARPHCVVCNLSF